MKSGDETSEISTDADVLPLFFEVHRNIVSTSCSGRVNQSWTWIGSIHGLDCIGLYLVG